MTETLNIREVVQLGAPVLRQIAEEITDFGSPKIKQTELELFSTLASTQGVGLAAPQIAESVRMVVIGSRPTLRYPNAPEMEPLLMINPSYESLSEDRKKDWEGCLSIPGIRAQVARYNQIEVSYCDNKGMKHRIQLDDFVARVFQHEYDHLEGKVYLDRVEDNRDIIAESEFQKLVNLANK